MTQSSRFTAILASAILAHVYCLSAVAADDHAFYHENVLGTSLELVVRTETAVTARAIEERVLAEIDRLAAIFSGYDRDSEFFRWQAAPKAPISVSSELFDVLRTSERWRTQSQGAFDPRVEVFSRLWERSARIKRLPNHDETSAAINLMMAPAWRMDPATQTVERLSDCPISLNGIAKGYIVEKACEVAFHGSAGLQSLLLNVGGDLRVRGAASRTVGIAAPWADSESSEPGTYIEVKNQSVATSGRSRRGFDINGIWYSHVFDPRSGVPVERVLSTTVVADRGADADALAKICGVLDPRESLRLVESVAGANCQIIMADGTIVRSRGWHRLERPTPAFLALAGLQDPVPSSATSRASVDKVHTKAEPRPAWNADFELVVNFEIDQPAAEKGRYRRPYVAVWLEDTEGKQVRTLALWVSQTGSGPFQWLPDLKRWFKSDEERKLAEKKDIFFTISRPTRPPGKYRLIWDGKDNHGKQLGGGEYTVLIEAAREHGTYQSIRRPVSLSNKAFSEDLKGNVEIRSATIEYRRKAASK